jgi:hypothetical protein
MGASLAEFPGWRSGWRKPDRRPIWEWARDELTLPPSYAIQGRFDISITRPLMAVFNGIQDPRVHKVRFRKPPRFGGSMIVDIASAWVICNDPGPIMSNYQSDADAKGHMKQKVWALWKSSKQLKAMLPVDRHDQTNTEVYFGPFFFVAQGANLNNLQGVGVRWLFNDETWLPVWHDLYQHAVYRTRDYERAGAYKIVDVSQAGMAGDVEDRNWRTGNQGVWGYRATNGTLTPLLFGGKREDGSRWGLIWNEDAKRKDGSWDKARAIETARYVCKETGHEYFDRPETIAGWNRDGGYINQRTDNNPDTLSYSVNGLLNRSFASLVDEKIDAMELAARGDMSAMRDWVQKSEVRPYEEVFLSVTVTSGAGYKVADYAEKQPIDGERFRTLMADRQQGMRGDSPHRWCEIRAWRGDASSRQLYYGRVDTKEAMRELQERYGVKDRQVWQDAAFEKHEVFKECAEYGWIACFGSNQNSWRHDIPNPDRSQPPLKVHYPFSPWQRTEQSGKVVFYLHFSEDYCADILANLAAGRGVAYEHPDDVLPAYLEQMKGEHKLWKGGRMTWEKIHATKPNHAFDTGKIGVCFALLMKLLAMTKRAAETKPEHAAA